MSQKATRKSAAVDDKSHSESPAKEIKKKLVVTLEKEAGVDKMNGDSNKNNDKNQSEKQSDKSEKQNGDKKAEKQNGEKKENKNVEKKSEKGDKKNEKLNGEKNDKKQNGDKDDKEKHDKVDQKKSAKAHNGVSDVTLNEKNGEEVIVIGDTVSDDSEDGLMIVDDQNDELFPELTYDDDDDVMDVNDVRSATRRSQPKETKLLKLKEDPPTMEQRKLRSTDSPKKIVEVAETTTKENGNDTNENGDSQENRKVDTNFSKSRVKVSPYRRSGRIADQTSTSIVANYTGNNTTLEMDITESFTEEPKNSSYLGSLRSVRGRRSYKLHKQTDVEDSKEVEERREKLRAKLQEQLSRPTGTVVGRKRKPEPESTDVGTDALTYESNLTKRAKLFDKLVSPFRRVASSTPLPQRRNAPIVGINTDLPMSVPIVPEKFDPETLKCESTSQAQISQNTQNIQTTQEPESKRCIIM